MTDDAEGGVAAVQPVAELFISTATALWATTYSIDLPLFSEFLLARLGDPPLNVAVLADHRRLAARPPADSSRAGRHAHHGEPPLASTQRPRYRAIPSQSYLAVTGSYVTLLVGSGNLSAGG